MVSIFRTFSSVVVVTGLVLSPVIGVHSVFAAAPLPSATYSSMSVDKTELGANGIDMARVSITVKDDNLNAITGAHVTLTSSRGSDDDIKPETTATDLLGKMRFQIRSLKPGTGIFTATANDRPMTKTVRITFTSTTNASFVNLQPGDLIKIPEDGDVQTLSDTAVYMYASDGKRYVFPNEKVYFSWYSDFKNVKTIPIEQMSTIPIGANVTYHPGFNLVKFQTDPKTYAVTRGGVLRWVKSEAIAQRWFGANWSRHVDDISEAFYVNYVFGEPVENALDIDPETIYKSTNTIEKDKGIDQRHF